MQLLSRDAYQERLNPWLNKNLHFAHCLPMPFPRFHSLIFNEMFLFGVATINFALVWGGLSVLFSFPGLSHNSNVVENLTSAFKAPEGLIVFIFVLIIFRAVMFFLGKLNDEFAIMATAFLAMLSIPFFAEGATALAAWINAKPTNYSIPSSTSLIMGFLLAHVFARSFVRQFEAAQSKNEIGVRNH